MRTTYLRVEAPDEASCAARVAEVQDAIARLLPA